LTILFFTVIIRNKWFSGREIMELKERVLGALEENPDVYVSGASLARMLGVSRSAVWKAVKALKESGYSIDAGTNRGYRLSGDGDVVSERGIKKRLSQELLFLSFNIKKSVSSTNAFLKSLAANGAGEGEVVIADSQSEGRGRNGRGFFSPPGTGLYFSLLLRPKFDAGTAALITSAAAVSVCEAIRKTAGIETTIKWVNDVYLNGGKVCGILTEGSQDFETGGLSYVIVGVGINLKTPEGGFPEELKNTAGALFRDGTYISGIKNDLIAEFLNIFFGIYRKLPDREFIMDYKNRSLAVGKRILIHGADGAEEALALGIDENARLVVRLANGEIRTLPAGEISIIK